MTESGTALHEGEAIAGTAATAISLTVFIAVTARFPEKLLSPPRHAPAVVRPTRLRTAVTVFASGPRGTQPANVGDRLVRQAHR
ncbi:hypothetical protein [Mycobacterium gordonae]|uniref:Uncharacterized protein n=1 Tax=Mycobacterium gordonae TaxID=1778 RepID=A0A1X1W0Q0_MYCGO|nr:hypothetical protein [Mycobacterium gordonae]MCV7007136.1 hypothetical protein [Mycobacterium gordonae]ODR24505.1 hypothetical protein BHQ23_00430 [Mycobacterium gordonae]ORV78758.1 hypothetical protein AWC08_31560 [Mycobacterium gordonae]